MGHDANVGDALATAVVPMETMQFDLNQFIGHLELSKSIERNT
jgi:hypothetical protein